MQLLCRVMLGSLLLDMTLSGANAQTGNYSDESIEQLNGLFRQVFAESLSDELSVTDPVILVRGDNLILLQKGQRVVGSAVHSNYHDLKTIAHVPLSIFSVLRKATGEALTARQRDQLIGLSDLVGKTENVAGDCFDNSVVLERQQRLLAGSQKFLSSVLKKGSCSQKELANFIRSMRPDVLVNVSDASKLRIDNYHSQLLQWRKNFSEAEWQRLFVVIPGVAAARKENLAVQYFSKALRQRGEGSRIIYAESSFEESEALKQLGVHLLSRDIGLAFFDDPWRMHRDLLATASGTYLDQLDFRELYAAPR